MSVGSVKGLQYLEEARLAPEFLAEGTVRLPAGPLRARWTVFSPSTVIEVMVRFGLILCFVLGGGTVFVDSDGYFCAGKGYLAYETSFD